MICHTCKQDKELSEFYIDRKKFRKRCKSCTRKYIRVSHWKERRIKITWEEYEALYDLQSGCCAVCQRRLSIDDCVKGNTASIDHDHKTGIVRGLLCDSCNRALGLLGDSIDNVNRLSSYLDK